MLIAQRKDDADDASCHGKAGDDVDDKTLGQHRPSLRVMFSFGVSLDE
jgi:hypothetical protein